MGTFVGRTRELATLDAALDDAVNGRARCVLVAGEPGIGKTSIARELSRAATERGVGVVWSRCWDWGGAAAYWSFVEIVRAVTGRVDDLALRALVGRSAATIGALVAEVADRLGVEPIVEPRTADHARFELLDAVSAFVRGASVATPLLVVLDDLHGADVPSLELLRFVVRDTRPARLMLLGTYRTVDARATPDATAALAAVARDATVVGLAGLDETEVGAMLEAARSERADLGGEARTLHALTRGNPLFLDGMIRARAQVGASLDGDVALPQDVRAAITDRLVALGPEARLLLEAAAVLGRPFSLALAQNVTGLGIDRLLDSVTHAIDAGLLSRSDGTTTRLEVFHPLVREVAEGSLRHSDRLRWHRRIGEALERLYGDERSAHAAELAHHFVEAAPLGDAARAIDYASEAGRRAMNVGAFEDAAHWFGQALETVSWLSSDASSEARRLTLLDAIGHATLAAGQTQVARDVFGRVLTVAREREDGESFARAALGIARTFEFGLREPARLEPLEEAIVRLEGTESPLLARVMARLASDLWSDSTASVELRRADLSRRAMLLARTLGDPDLVATTIDARLLSVWGPEHIQERIAMTAELATLARQSRRLERELEAHRWRINVLVEVGDMPATYEAIDDYTRVANTLRWPQYIGNALLRQVLQHQMAGRFDEAVALGDSARDAMRLAGDPQADVVHASRAAMFAAQRGRADELRSALPTLEALVAERPRFALYRSILVHALVAAHEHRRALPHWEWLARDDFASSGRDMMTPATLSMLAEPAIALGDETAASSLRRRLAPYRKLHAAIGATYSHGAVERYLGLLALFAGEATAAVEHLENALAANERLGAHVFTAFTAFDLARALRAVGSPDADRARTLVERAGTMARDLGLAALASAIDEQPSGSVGDPNVHAASPAQDGVAGSTTRALLRSEGAVWLVQCGTQSARIKASRGLRYLVRLIERPGVELHVLDLLGEGRAEEGLPLRDAHAGAVLDERAKRAYRQRLEDLRETLDEAERHGDVGRARRAREEIDAIGDELARAVGLGGRDRKAASSAERARVSVTKAITRAVSSIEQELPQLGRHLSLSVRTGLYCRYEPDPGAQLVWHL